MQKMSTKGVVPDTNGSGENEEVLVNEDNGMNCYVDGSWTQDWQGGVGVVLFKGEELLVYISEEVGACCPLQVEAIALRKAVQLVKTMGIHECTFHTDNQCLMEVVSQSQPPMESDWRALVIIFELWKIFRLSPLFRCVKVERSHNGLADLLAKKSRIGKWKYRGYTFPLF